MPLRLDNARALPTCPQQQTKKTFKPRFKVDHAASPMPKTRQPERLAPRATSNRNGGRDHLGILGEIKSVHPGEIIGISSSGVLVGTKRMLALVTAAQMASASAASFFCRLT